MGDLPDFGKVRSLRDVLRIQQYVYSLVPWTFVPFTDKITEIKLVKPGFENLSIGGWCGLNAEILKYILKSLKIPCESYNYGFQGAKFTHVCVIVDFNGILFLLDPYFNKHYTYANDFPLSFKELLRLISENKTDVITAEYGPGLKKVETLAGFIEMGGQELEASVLKSFYDKGLGELLSNLSGDIYSMLLHRVK
jgi:hypothetical protein